MLTVPVSLPHAPYVVKIAPGLLASVGREAREIFPDAKACALVTDSKVGPLYAAAVEAALRAEGFDPVVITVPAGEPAK
ncbi:MAG: 3-dehydroquinate synthase, partial [Verrucomicrobiales bacterium]|nr:3-dehydroquinate synthase [Verrucomicrobiales bacterium]